MSLSVSFLLSLLLLSFEAFEFFRYVSCAFEFWMIRKLVVAVVSCCDDFA